jgi:multidrug efflux system membrane fusion protein
MCIRPLAALLSATLVVGCSMGRDAGKPPAADTGRPAQPPSIPIAVARVTAKAIPIEIRAIGTTEPSATVAVHAQITGELTEVAFTEGDDVSRGQVLFQLDRRPLEAALAQAQANLARDTATKTSAAASAARYQDLLQRGIATREQADQARANAEALDATVGADHAAVDNAVVQLHYAAITAPISGRTGMVMVQRGNLVRANDTTPLVVINQVSPLNVTFGIPDNQLTALKRYLAQGTLRVAATPSGDGSMASEGRISFIDNTVDQTTGTIKIKGSFANAKRQLWPGQFVKVVVTLTTEPRAIVVPTAAVQKNQQGSYVFVVTAGSTVDLRPVRVDRAVGDDSVIAEGLAPGETVVTDGHIRLVPGSRVSIKDGAGAADVKSAP